MAMVCRYGYPKALKWICGLALCCVFVSSASPGAAQETGTKLPADIEDEKASGVSEQRIIELTSTNSIAFLKTNTLIEKGISSRSNVVLSFVDETPLLKAALARELTESQKTHLMADVAQKTVVNGDQRQNEKKSGTSDRIRGIQLETDNTVVDDDPVHDWPRPDYLLSFRLYSGVPNPTSWSISDTKQPLSSDATFACLSVRSIDASKGRAVEHVLQCATKKEVQENTSTLIRTSVQKHCTNTPLVVPMPVRTVGQKPFSTDRFNQLVTRTLSSAGCRVQDIPSRTPGTSSVKHVRSEKGMEKLAWRYHRRFLSLAHPAMFKNWEDGDIALTIDRTKVEMEAANLRTFLKNAPDPKFLDPDLKGSIDSRTVEFFRYKLEAVAVDSGEIRLSAVLYAGGGTPADVIAKSIVDLLTAESDRGWLEVHRVPPNANLRVDGTTVEAPGTAPQLLELEPGSHKIELILNEQTEQSVEYEAKPLTYGVAGLVRPFGQLRIVTKPKGAKVAVDGEVWGSSPIQQTVAAKLHKVVVQKKGCGAPVERKDVRVRAGGKKTEKIPLNGWIKAEAIPKSASIQIGEESKSGSGKWELAGMKSYSVDYNLSNYPDKTNKSVLVRPCETTEVQYSFHGKFVASSDPGGADVRVDGKSIGTAETSKFFRPGEYNGRCVWCGYGHREKQFQIKPGETEEVNFPLEPPGFQFEIGGALGAENLGQGFGVGGAGRVAGWLNGRWGILGRFGASSRTEIAWNGGGYLQSRLLAPGPGWNMPVGLGTEFLQVSENDKIQIAPAAHLGLRGCAGGNFGYGFHLYAGYNIQTELPVLGLRSDLALWFPAPSW